jgi:hypothetical protein
VDNGVAVSSRGCLRDSRLITAEIVTGERRASLDQVRHDAVCEIALIEGAGSLLGNQPERPGEVRLPDHHRR